VKRLLPAWLLLLLVLASASTAVNAMIAEPSFDWPATIVDPEYSRPAFVDAGSGANATLVCAGACKGEYTVELYSFNVSTVVPAVAVDYGNGTVLVEFTVPDNLPQGLYDVKVYVNGTPIAWEPRAYYVKHGPIEALTIIHMTDIHLGASDNGIDNIMKNTKYVLISNVVARDYGVNVAIVTGDIADVGTDTPSLKAIWTQYNQFRIPTFLVPGNHDWAQVPNLDAFLNKFYGKYVNSKQYWYRVVDGFIIVGLDTMGNGFLSFEQIEFLNETLTQYPDKKAIILFHHPVFNQPGEYSGPVDSWISYVYGSWADHRSNLEAFINVINSHPNVVLVMSGHIHRDADAVYNTDHGKVYFVTTTTANHGTPTYWGFKLVRVYENGTVEIILPPGKAEDAISRGRSSFNAEYIWSYEHANPERTTVVWELGASRLAELNLDNVTLLFYVNASQGPYEVYDLAGTVHAYTVYAYGDYLVYAVQAAVSQGDQLETPYVVVSNTPDEQPPSVEVTMISPTVVYEGAKVNVYVAASDGEWGVSKVKVAYRVDNGPWHEVEARNYKTYYLAQIGPLAAGTVEVVAKAWDFAGNSAESQAYTFQVKARATTTTTTAETTTSETTTTTSYEEAETTTTGEEDTATQTTTTTAAQEEGGVPAILVAAVIAAIVIAGLAIVFRR